jgi:hypothetical protein
LQDVDRGVAAFEVLGLDAIREQAASSGGKG